METCVELPAHAASQQSGYLLVMLQHLEESISNDIRPPATQKALMVQFQELINQHYLSRWNIETYADRLLVSEKKLSQICRETTGRTPNDLIQERLLLEAKRLLIHTSSNISEIAYDLHFHDPSHFVKFFKKQTNLTPGEFLRLWETKKDS